VDHTVDAVTFSVFMNSGQICVSGDRILVHESLAEEFTGSTRQRPRFLRLSSVGAGGRADAAWRGWNRAD